MNKSFPLRPMFLLQLVPFLPFVAILTLAIATRAWPAETVLNTHFLTLKHGLLEVRVGTQAPVGRIPVGDVLFIHGLGDRLDNHAPLFAAWNAAGLRVIALDLPGHGETYGLGNHLNLFSFTELGEIVAAVEASTRESATRPLVLAGWSTGGLLAVRMVQSTSFAALGRPVAGLVLFAPGVSVRMIVGDAGRITEASLTRNAHPPHLPVGKPEIKPASPFEVPLFAKKLMANSLLAEHQDLPAALPVFIALAGDDTDAYVKSKDVREWLQKQRGKGRPIVAVQCDRAYHELDNEPNPVGTFVRDAAAAMSVSFAARPGTAVSPPLALPVGECRAI